MSSGERGSAAQSSLAAASRGLGPTARMKMKISALLLLRLLPLLLLLLPLVAAGKSGLTTASQPLTLFALLKGSWFTAALITESFPLTDVAPPVSRFSSLLPVLFRCFDCVLLSGRLLRNHHLQTFHCTYSTSS